MKTLLEVINFPWFPQHEAKEYIPITEPLLDFEPHLQSGINELKSSHSVSNFIILQNELTQLKEGDLPNYQPFGASSSSPRKISRTKNMCVLTNIESPSNLMDDINQLHEHLTRELRHPLGRGGT